MKVSRRKLAGAALLAPIAIPVFAQERPATGPLVKVERKPVLAPTVQGQKVGDISVYAISDGSLAIENQYIIDADLEEMAALKEKAFLEPDAPTRSACNAYLVETSDERVLIDAGSGRKLDVFPGAKLGSLVDNLQAVGVDPNTIDTILLTHLHLDHSGGIATDDDFQAVFPNAELVVHENDWAFWMSPDTLAGAQTDQDKYFVGTTQKTANAYAGRVRLFNSDVEVVPGIQAMAMPGHTPGHTGYLISSGSESLLVWGDIVHLPLFQFAHPDWGVVFDGDPGAAVRTRERVLDMVATDRLLVAGTHMFFPGFGHVERKDDQFAFVPAPYSYDF